jgi:hypothetical protein
VWCARGFLQEAEGSNLHTASDAHENIVMAMGQQPYIMTLQSYARFPSTDIWDNVTLNVCSLHPKGKTLPHGGRFKLHRAPAALDLAFNTPCVEDELSNYDFFFRYTKQGSLKDHTDCAPNNGYYFLPLYDKGEYVLKVRHFDKGQGLLLFRISQNLYECCSRVQLVHSHVCSVVSFCLFLA